MDKFDPAWAQRLKDKYGIAHPMAPETGDAVFQQMFEHPQEDAFQLPVEGGLSEDFSDR